VIDHSKVVEYCAIEVQRQQAGPIYVAHMYNAWEYALSFNGVKLQFLVEQDFKTLNSLVLGLPYQDYRNTPVVFASGGPSTSPGLVSRAMQTLMGGLKEQIPADEWVKMFLHIHPFRDGNGRVGSLLWNLLNGTITQPIAMPDFFGGE
jgi:hypothetical protein